MEYLPYKIDAGSHRIKIYQTEFHGLRSFSCITAGKEFLKEEAVNVVKYEESGKNAENCIYTTDKVVEDVASVKDGLFVEELDDGYALKKKEWTYGWSIYPTITEVSYFLLASLTCPSRTPKKNADAKDSKKAKLISELQSILSEGSQIPLKKTGLFNTLVNPVEEEPQKSVVPSYKEDFEDLNVPISTPVMLPLSLRDLPPLPALPTSFPNETVETFTAKVRALEYDLQEIEEERVRIEKKEKKIDLEIEEVRKERQWIEEQMHEIAELSTSYESTSTEYSYSSSEEEESSSEEEESSSEEEESSSEEEESSSEEEESSSEEEESSSEEEESSSEEEESSTESTYESEEEEDSSTESSTESEDLSSESSFWESPDDPDVVWYSEEEVNFGTCSL